MTSDTPNAVATSAPTPSRGINLSGIAGFALIVFLVTAAIAMGGHPLIFINWGAAIIVMGGTIGMGLMACGARELFHAIFSLRVVVVHVSRDALHRRDTDVLRTLTIYCYASGVIGTGIGAIQILASISDFNQLGPATGVGLLTIFYALLASETLLRPAARMIERGLRD